MNKTEHDLLMSFDPEYSDKNEKLKLERKLLLDRLVSYYSRLEIDFRIILLISLVFYLITKNLSFLLPVFLFLLLIVIPAFYCLYKYSVVRKKLGL